MDEGLTSHPLCLALRAETEFSLDFGSLLHLAESLLIRVWMKLGSYALHMPFMDYTLMSLSGFVFLVVPGPLFSS